MANAQKIDWDLLVKRGWDGEHNPNATSVSQPGYSVLSWCVGRANDQILPLLQAGANPSPVDIGWTYSTLIFQALTLAPDQFECLLDHGANPNECASHGQSILEATIHAHKIAEAKLLLERGANPHVSNMKKSALNQAILACSEDAVELLLQFKADPNQADPTGFTPLHNAARHPKTNRQVLLLLQAGGNIHAKCNLDRTPLMWACLNTTPQSSLTIQVLLDHGANVFDCCSEDGLSAIDYAVTSKNKQAVQILMNNGPLPALACKISSDVQNFLSVELAELKSRENRTAIIAELPDMDRPGLARKM